MGRILVRLKAMRLAFAILSLPLALLGCGRAGDGYESFSAKREYSILQGLEFKHRGETITQIEFQKHDEYWVICLPRSGDSSRLWIIADPKSPPFYKQMPEGDYILTKAQLEDIRQKVNPISTVIAALASHVSHP